MSLEEIGWDGFLAYLGAFLFIVLFAFFCQQMSTYHPNQQVSCPDYEYYAGNC